MLQLKAFLVPFPRKHVISINELILGMRRLQKVPDDTKIQAIAEVLDEDKDGIIDVNDAIKVSGRSLCPVAQQTLS